jgi:GTP cyclohydrolase I
VDGWVAFPWERDAGQPTDAVVRLLQHIGEDATREGLRQTPARVLRALQEMTDGYRGDAAELLATTFAADGCDEMVVVHGIPFTSLCEHHLLPFTGAATVGYIPDGRIVGLSKLARVVDLYAHRLQVQERMTTQIAAAIEHALSPVGVGTVVRARHSCMGCRGARKPEAVMVTSAMLGSLRSDHMARAEFLALEQRGNGHG